MSVIFSSVILHLQRRWQIFTTNFKKTELTWLPFNVKVAVIETANTVGTLFIRIYTPLSFFLNMHSETVVSTIYCVSIKKLKKLVRQCELWALCVPLFSQSRVLPVSYTRKILLLCLLCISFDPGGFSRGSALSLSLLFVNSKKRIIL